MANPDQLDIDIEAQPLVRAARIILTIHNSTIDSLDNGLRMYKTIDGVKNDVTDHYREETEAAHKKCTDLIERIYRANGVTTETLDIVKELEGFDTPYRMTLPESPSIAETRESATDVADDATHAIHLPGDR